MTTEPPAFAAAMTGLNAATASHGDRLSMIAFFGASRWVRSIGMLP